MSQEHESNLEQRNCEICFLKANCNAKLQDEFIAAQPSMGVSSKRCPGHSEQCRCGNTFRFSELELTRFFNHGKTPGTPLRKKCNECIEKRKAKDVAAVDGSVDALDNMMTKLSVEHQAEAQPSKTDALKGLLMKPEPVSAVSKTVHIGDVDIKVNNVKSSGIVSSTLPPSSTPVKFNINTPKSGQKKVPLEKTPRDLEREERKKGVPITNPTPRKTPINVYCGGGKHCGYSIDYNLDTGDFPTHCAVKSKDRSVHQSNWREIICVHNRCFIDFKDLPYALEYHCCPHCHVNLHGGVISTFGLVLH